jgi:hypothetical protein
MQQAQVITYGIDGILAERLREMAQGQRIWLRETSLLSACRSLVQTSPLSVLVLALGSDLPAELALLEQVHACLPGTRVVVIGDADNPALAGLAWELGAAYALFPPTPAELINELVVRMLPGTGP